MDPLQKSHLSLSRQRVIKMKQQRASSTRSLKLSVKSRRWMNLKTSTKKRVRNEMLYNAWRAILRTTRNRWIRGISKHY